MFFNRHLNVPWDQTGLIQIQTLFQLQIGVSAHETFENAVSTWWGLLEEVEYFLFEATRRTGAPGVGLVMESHRTGGSLHGDTV